MIFTSGIIIFIGLVLIFIKLPKRLALRLLGHSMRLDITVSALAYALHWGTYTGVMAAAFAGLMCSIFTMGSRFIFGYIKDGAYHPGFIHVKT